MGAAARADFAANALFIIPSGLGASLPIISPKTLLYESSSIALASAEGAESAALRRRRDKMPMAMAVLPRAYSVARKRVREEFS
jgi:hypothetical protein